MSVCGERRVLFLFLIISGSMVNELEYSEISDLSPKMQLLCESNVIMMKPNSNKIQLSRKTAFLEIETFII